MIRKTVPNPSRLNLISYPSMHFKSSSALDSCQAMEPSRLHRDRVIDVLQALLGFSDSSLDSRSRLFNEGSEKEKDIYHSYLILELSSSLI